VLKTKDWFGNWQIRLSASQNAWGRKRIFWLSKEMLLLAYFKIKKTIQHFLNYSFTFFPNRKYSLIAYLKIIGVSLVKEFKQKACPAKAGNNFILGKE
jgi:hypothetical protein